MEIDILDFIEQCRGLAKQALGKHTGEPASGGFARWIHVVLHCFRVEESHSYRETPNRLKYIAEVREALDLDRDELPDHTTLYKSEELREWRGRAIRLEGKQVYDVVDDLKREYIDVEVEVSFQRREYEGTQSWDTKRFRVVGVRNEDADDYQLYMTNLSRSEFLPGDIAKIYRCRWEVELLFRELKTRYDLDEFDTSKEHVVRILLYAALLSLLVSRSLLDLLTEQAEEEIVFPPERWAATFRSHAQLILHELGEYLGYSPPPLLERLIEDAQKIHKQRPIHQETLATATQPRAEA